MRQHDLIVVGGSAGGLETLKELVHRLPKGLPAAVCVVLHLNPNTPAILGRILGRGSRLVVRDAVDGEALKLGHVYIAPPDYHLLVEPGIVRVACTPKENGHRPAVDVLFRSAAVAYGARVIGVILSGALDDGTAGLADIQQRGGLAVVQDPHEALFGGMPQSAIDNLHVDHVVSLDKMPSLLTYLVTMPAGDPNKYSIPERMLIETPIAKSGEEGMPEVEKLGQPSILTCPECGGTLIEVQDGELLRFRCHTGHAYSVDTLQADQSSQAEAALWSALRAMQETEEISRRIAARARQHHHQDMAERFEDKAKETAQHTAVLRKMLVGGQGPSDETQEVKGNNREGAK